MQVTGLDLSYKVLLKQPYPLTLVLSMAASLSLWQGWIGLNMAPYKINYFLTPELNSQDYLIGTMYHILNMIFKVLYNLAPFLSQTLPSPMCSSHIDSF